MDTIGQQMICTKDTAVSCYTDKFPYCLPACLDGYVMNASGQCVANNGMTPTASHIVSFNKYYLADKINSHIIEAIGQHDFCFLNQLNIPRDEDGGTMKTSCSVKKGATGIWTVDVLADIKNSEIETLECNVMCVTDTPETPPSLVIISFSKYYLTDGEDHIIETIGKHDFCYLNQFGLSSSGKTRDSSCSVKKDNSGIWTVDILGSAGGEKVECNVMCVTDTPETPPPPGLISFNKNYLTLSPNKHISEAIGQHDFCFLNQFNLPRTAHAMSNSCSVKKDNFGIWTVDIFTSVDTKNTDCNVMCVGGGSSLTATPSSCQNFTYPTNNANYTYDSATGYVIGDSTGATQFCTSK
jgi:hypothetical protein